MSAEAVNLDTPDALTDGFGSIWSNLDATPNVDVLVEGNVFANMVRGLGTHNFSGGRYHTRIAVVGNTFTGMRNDAIRVMNWRDSAIIGNTFDGVWCPSHGNDCRGILASGAENLTRAGQRLREHGPRHPVHAVGQRRAGGRLRRHLQRPDRHQPARPRLQHRRAGPAAARGDHQPEFRVFWPAGIVRFSGF